MEDSQGQIIGRPGDSVKKSAQAAKASTLDSPAKTGNLGKIQFEMCISCTEPGFHQGWIPIIVQAVAGKHPIS